MIGTMLMKYWEELNDLFDICAQLDFIETVFHQVLLVKGPTLHQLLEDVEILFIMEKQVDFCLVSMIYHLIFRKKTHNFPPMSRVFLFFDDFEAEELPSDAWLDFPRDRVCPYGYTLSDVIILHKLPALVLVVVLYGWYGPAGVGSVTPIRAVSELATPELARIIIVKHLLDDHLQVLLRDLVLGRFLLACTLGSILHIHYRVTLWLHLVCIPGNDAKQLILVLFHNKSLSLSLILLHHHTLASVHNEGRVRHHGHRTTRHLLIMLEYSQAKGRMVHQAWQATHRRGHAWAHNQVRGLTCTCHQVWEGLVFRLSWGQTIFCHYSSHVTNPS